MSLTGRGRAIAARAFRGPGARAAAAMLERLAGSPAGTYAVLTYHRVDDPGARPWLYPSLLSATPQGFEAQMTGLARQHRPVDLAEVLAAHRGARALPPRAVLITFDDAYRDFGEHAWPILRRLRIPVTLFVPTAYPDAPGRSFWWDRVWQAVSAAPSDAAFETPIGQLPLGTDQERRVAARALIDHFKALPHAAALQGVDELIGRVAHRQATTEVLAWDELRSLRDDGVQLAAHSRTHPLLTRVATADASNEVEGSRADLERELGGGVPKVFAYPSGAHDAETRRVLADLGIELAFTTDRGINHAGRSDPLALRRINVGIRAGSEAIRAQIAVARMRHRMRRN